MKWRLEESGAELVAMTPAPELYGLEGFEVTYQYPSMQAFFFASTHSRTQRDCNQPFNREERNNDSTSVLSRPLLIFF